MMLEEIVRRQNELAERLKREREEASKKRTKKTTSKALAPASKDAPKDAPKDEPKRKTPEDVKMVGVPVPLDMHTRMENVLGKLSTMPSAPKSKKQLMLRALERYLQEFELGELALDVANKHKDKGLAAVQAAIGSDKLDLNNPAAVSLENALKTMGLRDFFVGAGSDGLVVCHAPTSTGVLELLPPEFKGYRVQARQTPLDVVGAAYDIILGNNQ